MPAGDLLEPVIALVQGCCDLNARVVVDTHGTVLKGLVDAGLPWLIAPNVEELGELLGARVQDSPVKLVAASRPLLEKVPVVLISRGRKGAVVVTKRGAWAGSVKTRSKVLQTVGCGDYLLAGFLAGHSRGGSVRNSLATALKVATARAWGWTETRTWFQATKQIEVDVARI
jgi:fructose-1-phosphate kinase PfkB-like protein